MQALSIRTAFRRLRVATANTDCNGLVAYVTLVEKQFRNRRKIESLFLVKTIEEPQSANDPRLDEAFKALIDATEAKFPAKDEPVDLPSKADDKDCDCTGLRMSFVHVAEMLPIMPLHIRAPIDRYLGEIAKLEGIRVDAAIAEHDELVRRSI